MSDNEKPRIMIDAEPSVIPTGPHWLSAEVINIVDLACATPPVSYYLNDDIFDTEVSSIPGHETRHYVEDDDWWIKLGNVWERFMTYEINPWQGWPFGVNWPRSKRHRQIWATWLPTGHGFTWSLFPNAQAARETDEQYAARMAERKARK